MEGNQKKKQNVFSLGFHEESARINRNVLFFQTMKRQRKPNEKEIKNKCQILKGAVAGESNSQKTSAK